MRLLLAAVEAVVVVLLAGLLDLPVAKAAAATEYQQRRSRKVAVEPAEQPELMVQMGATVP
jgi:hypothetical protein